jgi:twitching motility protein PilT
MNIAQLLAFSIESQASDLHLSAGLPPMIRVHGDLRRIGVGALDHPAVHAMVTGIMSDTHRKHYAESLEVDFSFAIDGLARFRVNAFTQSRGAAAVFRVIPSRILTLEQLGAPPILGELALKPRGLVLVTGPTGSGKSTTLAAMVDHLNETRHGHILTVEDPIEFVHESKRCLIQQREVGSMTRSFANALRSALREDPDAILVGEMRDLETIHLAMTAAETGHLVFGTLHTTGAVKTIDRLIDALPADQREQTKSFLSQSLIAVVTQVLVKTPDNQGRRAVCEVMVMTKAIAKLIQSDQTHQIPSQLQTGREFGMQLLDQGLLAAVQAREVDPDSAYGFATDKRLLEKFVTDTSLLPKLDVNRTDRSDG